ncbi:COPI-interacting protein CEX1 KNAG_0H03470 [Huiozyma naganishii CBS 8797]|uniref:Protein kinase domain-containing protein n=1 Tax=Huiozyma naganishii (strain ATCC MYA-139 / BCRC 22969 / CBS 8797 / KCTC 17520 / NBRC 10181 / NCYC 3082 / Yp74L-3) TaxID=1071383 RepID=J7S9W9_HUIN7|nr:hypothetical protein KNAG_0H03470 [Kazachstania naganishii CBS 8797]CCK71761.1 hypothetical protein KNAG_0H03470 [Kazachstania naganishii CBS 8797]
MNFGSLFKNLANFQFPYTIESEPYHSTPLWDLYRGQRKKDSHDVTVFKAKCDGAAGSNCDELIMHAMHMIKVIRVPGICPLLDVFDSNGPDALFIVTEAVTPLSTALGEAGIGEAGLLLGLHDLFRLFQVLEPLFYIGNLSLENLFVDKQGNWVLFGLECCYEKAPEKFDRFKFKDYIKMWRGLHGFPPVADGAKSLDPSLIDAIALGELIEALFEAAKVRIPSDWGKYVQGLAQGRMTLTGFIQRVEQTATWRGNPLLPIYDELKLFHIKDAHSKLQIMQKFEQYYFRGGTRSLASQFTPGFIGQLIVPELVECLSWILNQENGLIVFNRTLVKLLTVVLSLVVEAREISELSEGMKDMLYLCSKLTDRQIRFVMLIFLPRLLEKFPKQLDFSGRIFPFYLQGMLDTDATLRLQTLKTIPYIIGELTERQLNNEILRSIAKTQVDANEEIRMWTVLTIVEISDRLSGVSNRDGVLATIYTKSLRDPSISTRLAALYGLKMSIGIFQVEVIANKVLTVIAPSLLDKDRVVRVRAKELFGLYLAKLEEEASLQFEKGEGEGESENESSDDHTAFLQRFEQGGYFARDLADIVDKFMTGLSVSPEDNLDSFGSTAAYGGFSTMSGDPTETLLGSGRWATPPASSAEPAEVVPEDDDAGWDAEDSSWDSTTTTPQETKPVRSSILSRPRQPQSTTRTAATPAAKRKPSILAGARRTPPAAAAPARGEKSILSRRPAGTLTATTPAEPEEDDWDSAW